MILTNETLNAMIDHYHPHPRATNKLLSIIAVIVFHGGNGHHH